MVGDLLDRAAARFPDRTAVVFGERRTTYRQLAERVGRLAGGLRGLGLRPGDRLALFLDNCDQAWELILACARTGIVWVPLNYMLKGREVAAIVRHAGARALAVGREHWPIVEPLLPELGLEAVVGVGDGAPGKPYQALIAESQPDRPDAPPRPDDLFCLLYTSGTTGLPKGTRLSHRAILAHARLARREYALTPGAVGLVVLPYFVGATLNCVQIPGLGQGITLVFNRKFSPAAFFELIRCERVTHVQTVPTMLVRLLESSEIDRADLSSIVTIGYGSAPMPVDRLRQLLDRFGPIFTQIYGLTETCAMATVLRRHEHTLAGAAARRLASCGRPAQGVEVRLVDEAGQEVGTDRPGEIVIRGPTLMDGYWNADEATAEAIRGGWFHSGDVARRDADGFIYISDRKKDMIITGGFNVYPKEVEEIVFTHPSVADCAVVGLPDPEWGEAVTAFVAPKAGAALDPDEIVELCRRELAGYKKPRRVVLVDEIPRNPSGKALKRVLRDRYAVVR
ncbi:MAG TPA: long-chain-fatty-acid--CoA ligase [Chloroflexota bacterium]|nr:long-chain-fatty-acid--CoA ligase [Chloroflexota bacterium]